MFELASEYGVHPITIGLWKKAVVQGLPRLFEGVQIDEGNNGTTDKTFADCDDADVCKT
jgi:hypothetical protein